MTDGRAAALLAELETAAQRIPTVDLAEAIGRLEGVKASLWSRLTQPPSQIAHAPGWRGEAGQERFLSAREAAARMGVSLDWLYANAGRLKFSCRLGRRWKFSESGLEEWIRGRK